MHLTERLPSSGSNLRNSALDVLYLLFLFVGALENGPPLSLLPIDATIIFGGFLALGVMTVLVQNPVVMISRDGLLAQLFLVGLVSWLSLSLVWAPPSDYGFGLVARLIIGVTVAFLYPIWIIGSDESRVTRLLWFMVIFGLGMATLFILHGRVPEFVPNRISLSRPIGLATIVLSARLATSRGWHVIIWLSLLLFLFYVMFQSGARAPLGGAIISSCAVLLFLQRRRLSARRLFTLPRVVAAVSCILVIATVVVQSSASLPTTLQRFELLLQGGGASVSYRLQFWEWSIAEWTTSVSTLLIGSGVGSFAAEYTGTIGANYPHNILIELALSGGLVALVMMLCVFAFTLRGIAREGVATTPVLVATGGIVLYMLINSLFSGNLYINKHLFLGLGLLVCLKSNNE